MTHSFVVNVPYAELAPEPLDPEQIVSGAPEVTGKVVWESADGRQVRGIWQITPGVVTDTEADELFVVVSGSATIEVEGGPTLTVGPGDMAVLREGDRTTWTVHETLPEGVRHHSVTSEAVVPLISNCGVTRLSRPSPPGRSKRSRRQRAARRPTSWPAPSTVVSQTCRSREMLVLS